MKKQNKKNGFTLVELLVVIAILAILATVSVIGYLSFTEKAKQSNDETLIAQLNTALQANEAIDGKPKTMSEALKVVEESGFLVENLTPTSAKNEFMWDQENNKFIIVSEETLGETTNSNYWVIVNDETLLTDLQDNYSVYLGNNYTDEDGIVNVANGFDAGNFEGINTINFATEEEITVTIRTNGGTLNVNASNAAVNHYGNSNMVDITSVANDSYHEYGVVLGNVYLEQGRFVVENGSKISNVIVTATTTEKVKVENYSTEIINVSATNESVVTNLGSITSGQTNNQTTVVDEDALRLFSGGVGTKDSPYLISSEEQLLNIATFDDTSIVNVKLINDIVLLNQLIISSGKITLDMDEHTITYTCDSIHNSSDKPSTDIINEGGVIDLKENASLTISGNGTFNFNDNYLNYPSIGMTFRLEGNSDLIVDSGSFYCGLTFVQCGDSSVCKINGGYFNTFASWNNKYWTLNLIDNSNASIVVYGGTFDMYNPAESHTENPVANFVAEGYESIRINGPTDDSFSYVVEKVN